MTIKKGNKRLFITLPESLVIALEEEGFQTQKEISFYILRLLMDNLELPKGKAKKK